MLKLKLRVVVLNLRYQYKRRLHYISMIRLAKTTVSGTDTYVDTKVFPMGRGYAFRQFSFLSVIHATLNFMIGPLSCSKTSLMVLKDI